MGTLTRQKRFEIIFLNRNFFFQSVFKIYGQRRALQPVK